MILGYGGTFSEPEVFKVLASGIEIRSLGKVRMRGMELLFQPFSDASPIVQAVLEENWRGRFYGAFSLRPTIADKSAVVGFYEVADADASKLFDRLAEWNIHELDWFHFASMPSEINTGRETDCFVTEVLVGSDSLREAPLGFTNTQRYREFTTEMTRRLGLVYGAEGQVRAEGASRERQ